jgi:hypothetical protein
MLYYEKRWLVLMIFILLLRFCTLYIRITPRNLTGFHITIVNLSEYSLPEYCNINC